MDRSRLSHALACIVETTQRHDFPANADILMTAQASPEERAPHARGYESVSCRIDVGEAEEATGAADGILVTLLVKASRFDQLLLSFAPTSSNLFRSLARGISDPAPGPWVSIEPDDEALVHDVFCLMAVVYAERRQDWDIVLESLAMALIATLMRRASETGDTPDADATVALALQDIASRPETVTLAGLAERYSYSPSRLSTLIRERCGKTFSELVREQRMERAGLLLKTTDVPVRTIATMVGYRSASNFYRAFERHFGMPPRQMRESRERDDDA